MILNNATSEPAGWKISSSTDSIEGTKSAESWGTVLPPGGPFNYTVEFTGPGGTAKAENVHNPDALATYTGDQVLITYPGA